MGGKAQDKADFKKKMRHCLLTATRYIKHFTNPFVGQDYLDMVKKKRIVQIQGNIQDILKHF